MQATYMLAWRCKRIAKLWAICLLMLCFCGCSAAEQPTITVAQPLEEEPNVHEAHTPVDPQPQSDDATVFSDSEYENLFVQMFHATGGSDTNSVQDCIDVNQSAYQTLLRGGENTAYYCFRQLIDRGALFAKMEGKPEPDLQMQLQCRVARDLTEAELGEAEYPELDDLSWFARLYNATVEHWDANGMDDYFQSNPVHYQLLKSIFAFPMSHLAATKRIGPIYDDVVFFAAHDAFCAVLMQDETGLAALNQDMLPLPPEDICNDRTLWSIAQNEDTSVVLRFSPVDDSTQTVAQIVFRPDPTNKKGSVTVEVFDVNNA